MEQRTGGERMTARAYKVEIRATVKGARIRGDVEVDAASEAAAAKAAIKRLRSGPPFKRIPARAFEIMAITEIRSNASFKRTRPHGTPPKRGRMTQAHGGPIKGIDDFVAGLARWLKDSVPSEDHDRVVTAVLSFAIDDPGYIADHTYGEIRDAAERAGYFGKRNPGDLKWKEDEQTITADDGRFRFVIFKETHKIAGIPHYQMHLEDRTARRQGGTFEATTIGQHKLDAERIAYYRTKPVGNPGKRTPQVLNANPCGGSALTLPEPVENPPKRAPSTLVMLGACTELIVDRTSGRTDMDGKRSYDDKRFDFSKKPLRWGLFSDTTGETVYIIHTARPRVVEPADVPSIEDVKEAKRLYAKWSDFKADPHGLGFDLADADATFKHYYGHALVIRYRSDKWTGKDTYYEHIFEKTALVYVGKPSRPQAFAIRSTAVKRLVTARGIVG